MFIIPASTKHFCVGTSRALLFAFDKMVVTSGTIHDIVSSFCGAAMILLILVSISSPTWNSISFVNVTIDQDFSGTSTSTSTQRRTLSFGVSGYTGSKARVGYYMPPNLPISPGDAIIFHHSSNFLILYPISAFLSGLAVLARLWCHWRTRYHRTATVFMYLFVVLATMFTSVAIPLDGLIFRVMSEALDRRQGIDVDLGNAFWIARGAVSMLFLGFITVTCWRCCCVEEEYVDPVALERVIQLYEERMSPRVGV